MVVPPIEENENVFFGSLLCVNDKLVSIVRIESKEEAPRTRLLDRNMNRRSAPCLFLLLLGYTVTVVQLSLRWKSTPPDEKDSSHSLLQARTMSFFQKNQVFAEHMVAGVSTVNASTHHKHWPGHERAFQVGRLYHCRNSRGHTELLPRVPDFIIGGTQKGGTTALMKLIKQHPMIVHTTSFESHFFDYDEEVKRLRNNFTGLSNESLCDLRSLYARKHFPVQKLVQNVSLLSFEKTPAYILEESTPARIKAITPWAKVIFSLRNPIDRAFSHYRMLRTRNQIPETDTFETVLATDLKVLRVRNYSVAAHEPFAQIKRVHPRRIKHLWKAKNLIYRGLYADQLIPWLEHFTVGKDLMVVQFERMLLEPHTVLDEILDFLGVHRHSYDPARLNVSYSPVKPDVEHILMDSTRHFLFRLYEPYNQRLAEILGEEWRGAWRSTQY